MSSSLPQLVAARKPAWDELERLLQAARSGQLSLAQLRTFDRLYRQTSSDLARVQSLFPHTDVHRHLNQLCAQAYGTIYRPPQPRWSALLHFYAVEFPRTVRAEAHAVALSAAVLGLGLLVGALMVYFEPSSAVRLIPESVRQSVAARQMWTDDLLALAPPGAVSASIATNNLSVSILAFASGMLLGIGTLYVLLFNGLQVGAVGAHCVQEGMGGPFFQFVLAHGPVEFSIIVLAGGAGLILGGAIIDPGELPRGQFLRMRSVQAVKLVLGAAPFLAGIGIIEGHVSPGGLFPWPAKVALGVSLFILFWVYLLRAGRSPGPSQAPPGGALQPSEAIKE